MFDNSWAKSKSEIYQFPYLEVLLLSYLLYQAEIIIANKALIFKKDIDSFTNKRRKYILNFDGKIRDVGSSISISESIVNVKINEQRAHLYKDLAMKKYARVTHRPTFEELFTELLRNRIQIENSEKLYKNLELKNSTKTPLNYQTHLQAIYTSRLFNFSKLPKPKNEENFERELEELTKSTSALSIVASKLHVPDF
ncbi:hypothetical protein Glove_117g232 [Diversispora epigaea]|uniref:Uncharacterized protein n=1 Tax=Diversispora epigaea TaxID=1348612 RepID=A0A397J0W4_9GLOM|nr:hypothetical protein Glove_117g232 [Diversispora epigaea]